MTRYQRIPHVVEAIQWDGTGDGYQRVKDWGSGHGLDFSPSGVLWVDSTQGWLQIKTGTWIVRDHRGHYPVFDAAFTASYELDPLAHLAADSTPGATS